LAEPIWSSDGPIDPSPRAAARLAVAPLRKVMRAFTAGDRVVAALAVVVLAYYFATPGIFEGKASGDGYQGFMYLPDLFQHGTLDAAAGGQFWINRLGRESTGHVANACPIGPVPFWVLPYFVALAVEKIAGGPILAAHWPLNGGSMFQFFMAGLGSLACGLAGAALLFRLLQRRLGTGAARFGTVGAVLATPLCFYLVTQPLYQHACAFLFVTLLVERWDAWRGEMTPARWAWLGAIGGAAMLMRLQEAIWLLVPALDALAAAWRALFDSPSTGSRPLTTSDDPARPERSAEGAKSKEALRAIAGALLLGAVALAVFAPQLAVWRYYYGSLRPPQPPGHMRWSDPAIVATIFSTRAGLLSWSPILYLVAPGLWLARRRLRGLAGRLALLAIIELWVNASAWDHWGSWSFGARRFTDATVVYGAGLAGLWAAAEAARPSLGRYARRALIGLAALAVLYNGLLMELVRQRYLKSSGAGAFPTATWVRWGRGPALLGRIFEKIGYPFCQPAGWIYSLVYRVPPSAFEGVVGNYLPERDWRTHAVAVGGFDFTEAEAQRFVVEGIAGPPVAGAAPVARRVRVLVPMFAREAVQLELRGDFRGNERAVAAAWNGSALAARAEPGRVLVDVEASLVHTRSRTNVLVLDLPDGCALRHLEVRPRTAILR
jgi:hypothetical protein